MVWLLFFVSDTDYKPRVQHRLIDEHHQVHTESDYHSDPHGLGYYFDTGNIVSNHGFPYYYGGPHDYGHYAPPPHQYGGGYAKSGYKPSSSSLEYQPPQVVVIKKIIPLSTTSAPPAGR